jgi:shikimate kinase
MNIILIGFKSAGKTSVGKGLAAKMERVFLDVDDEVARLYQQKNGESLTAREIYKKLGDAGYRVLEQEVILTLGNLDNTIIATGGGSVCDPVNVQALARHGKFVYLDVAQDVIKARLAQDLSVALLDANHPANRFEASFAKRKKIYLDIADIIIKVDTKEINEIVDEIFEVYDGE